MIQVMGWGNIKGSSRRKSDGKELLILARPVWPYTLFACFIHTRKYTRNERTQLLKCFLDVELLDECAAAKPLLV